MTSRKPRKRSASLRERTNQIDSAISFCIGKSPVAVDSICRSGGALDNRVQKKSGGCPVWFVARRLLEVPYSFLITGWDRKSGEVALVACDRKAGGRIGRRTDQPAVFGTDGGLQF